MRTGKSSRCTVGDRKKRTTVACVSYLYPRLGPHLQLYEIDMSEIVSGFSLPTPCQFRYFLYFCELQSPVSILLYSSYNYFHYTCSLYFWTLQLNPFALYTVISPLHSYGAVSYTHLDVYKRQRFLLCPCISIKCSLDQPF